MEGSGPGSPRSRGFPPLQGPVSLASVCNVGLWVRHGSLASG